MNTHFLSLARLDTKHVFRDRTLLLFLFMPIFITLLSKWGLPYITSFYPDLGPYYPLFMTFGAIQSAVMFGFIGAFILLEEKDEQVIQALRILPISPLTFIVNRLGFMTLLSGLGAWFFIEVVDLAYPGRPAALLIALHCALIAPMVMMAVGAKAKNKVEGMAFFKAVNLLLILPALSFFFYGWWSFLFFAFPTFWTLKFYSNVIDGAPVMGIYIVGSIIYLFVLFLLYQSFRRRVFER